MGILEPSVLTLFQGWGRLLAFLAGATQLIVSIESWIDEKGPYQNNALLHAMSLVAGFWFTAEMILVPNYVFGSFVKNSSMLAALRIPWGLAMSVFTFMMVGVKHHSDMLDNDLIKWSRYTLVGLAMVISSVHLWANPKHGVHRLFDRPERKLWTYPDTSSHGYMTKRWYEEKIVQQVNFGGFNINFFFGLPLLVCPAIAIMAETRALQDGPEEDVIVHAATITITIILICDAFFFMIDRNLRPIHQATLWVHLYVAARAAEEYGNWVMFAAIAPTVPWVLIELWGSGGKLFFGYGAAAKHNFFKEQNLYRTLYRFFYILAVWCGVFAIVCWVVGWYGEWISFDIDNGTLVQSVIDIMQAIEEQITTFIMNVYKIINKLSICGALDIDQSLIDPGLLDDVTFTDLGKVGAASIFAYVEAGSTYLQFTDSIQTANCCTCNMERPQGWAGLEFLESDCDATSATDCAQSDYFLTSILNQSLLVDSVSDVLDNFPKTCKQSDIPPPSDDVNDTEDQEMIDDLAAWTTLQETMTNEVDADSQKVQESPLASKWDPDCDGDDCLTDVEQWEDPNADSQAGATTCAKVQCGIVIAALAGGTVASFIPLIGPLVGTAAKTAARVVFELFKFVGRMKRSSRRSNYKRKKFRIVRKAFGKLFDVGKKAAGAAAGAAKSGAKKMIGTTEDLIYAFIPLFALGFVSIFTAFWERVESKEARPALKGMMMGLLFANLVGAGLATFIPYIAKVIAKALPEEIVQITVEEEQGWLWIKYATWFSAASCFFWGLSLLFDNAHDRAVVPITPVAEPVAPKADLETSSKLRIAKVFRKPGQKTKPLGKNPFVQSYFDNADWTARDQAEWINNLLWLTPVIVITAMVFYNGTPIFRVYSNVRPETWGNMTTMSAEEGIQESLAGFGDEEKSKTLCSVVGVFVQGLIAEAARTVGQSVIKMFDTIIVWFKTAFYQLRLLRDLLRFLPELNIDFLVDNTSLWFAFGCPMLAAAISVYGVLISILPVAPLLKSLTNIDYLHSVQYLLGVGGLSLALTMYGISGVIASVPIPIISFDIRTTNVLLHAVICNILVLVSYLNYMFNARVPLYPKNN